MPVAQEFVVAYDLFDRDDRVRVVVLTADHTAPAFCSGVRSYFYTLPLVALQTAISFLPQSQADLSGGWGIIYSEEDKRQGRHSEHSPSTRLGKPFLPSLRLSLAHRDLGGKITLAIFRCRKITIAAVNGHAAGVGITGLQLPCDFRFVWSGAKLALPFVRRGIAPEGTHTLNPSFLSVSRTQPKAGPSVCMWGVRLRTIL